jgi:integrase
MEFTPVHPLTPAKEVAINTENEPNACEGAAERPDAGRTALPGESPPPWRPDCESEPESHLPPVPPQADRRLPRKRRRRSQHPKVKAKPRKGGYKVWQFQFRDANGISRTVTLGRCARMTKTQAEIKRDQILAPINALAAQDVTTPAHTLASYVEQVFLPHQLRYKWRDDSTALTTEPLIRGHLLAAFGPRPIESLRREELQQWLERMAATHSKSVVGQLRSQIRKLFRMADQDHLIAQNPAGQLEMPKHCRPSPAKRALTLDEAERLLSILEGADKVIAALEMYMGLRISETLGMRLDRVDLDAGELLVRQRNHRGRIGPPKNRRGLREVPLPGQAREILTEWVGRLRDRRPEAWLFPSENGRTPLLGNNVRRRFRRKLESAGLAWADFRVMRRSCASLLQELGVPPVVRAAILGHSVKVEENDYVVVSREQKREALNRLGSDATV